MIFASDNWSGASATVMAALAEAARRGGPAYGADDLTKAVEQRFADVFDHDVRVFLVGSGTAANALALSAYARPGGLVFAHHEAHIAVDEAGATEFFGAGVKLVTLDGEDGKIAPETLAAALDRYPEGGLPHHGQPVAVSITQITESGALYLPEEIAAISAVARSRGLPLHMDGARFANAVVALGAYPAQIAWRAGVDVLSFGGTKNGCLAAEAVIFFDAADAHDAAFIRQRAGHGFSKNWFIAAQLNAYLGDGHWLDLARVANRAAARLAGALRASPEARLAREPGGNEVFAILTRAADMRLRSAGAVYYTWPAVAGLAGDEVMVRLVTSWQTTEDEIDRFAAFLA